MVEEIKEAEIVEDNQLSTSSSFVVENKLIVIMGRNGMGKSSLANAILEDEKAFKTSSLNEDCTKYPQVKNCRQQNKRFYVMDTPGLNFQKDKYEANDLKESIQLVLLNHEKSAILTQIDCLILVHKYGIETDFKKLREQLEEIFRPEILPTVAVIITNYDGMILNNEEGKRREIEEDYRLKIREGLSPQTTVHFFALPTQQVMKRIVRKKLDSLIEHINQQNDTIFELANNNQIIPPYKVSVLEEYRTKLLISMDKYLNTIIQNPTPHVLKDSYEIMYIPLSFKMKVSKKGVGIKEIALGMGGAASGFGGSVATGCGLAAGGVVAVDVVAAEGVMLSGAQAVAAYLPTVLACPAVWGVAVATGAVVLAGYLLLRDKGDETKGLCSNLDVDSLTHLNINDRIKALLLIQTIGFMIVKAKGKLGDCIDMDIKLKKNTKYKQSLINELEIHKVDVGDNGFANVSQENKNEVNIKWQAPSLSKGKDNVDIVTYAMIDARIPKLDTLRLHEKWEDIKKELKTK